MLLSFVVVVIVYCLPADGVEAECGQGFFNCTNGKCINLHSYCDGANDCGDESDEQDCRKWELRNSHS